MYLQTQDQVSFLNLNKIKTYMELRLPFLKIQV